MSDESNLPTVPASGLGGGVSITNMSGGFLPAPATLKDAVDFAQLMAKAGSMVGKSFRGNPGACLAIYMQAGRLGMDPFALSLKAYEVNGSIAYEGQAIMAIIYASGALKGRLKFTIEGDGDDRVIHVYGRMKDDPDEKPYKSPPLKVLRDGGRSPLWAKDPEQQMRYYGARAWARAHCPDVIMGVYSVDEMEDAAMINVTDATKDNAASRLTSNLNQFEQDRKAKALADPADAELKADAFEGVADYSEFIEIATRRETIEDAEERAYACSWCDDDETKELVRDNADQRIAALEEASEPVREEA